MPKTRGVVDLLEGQHHLGREASQGMKFTLPGHPADLVESAKEWREKMVEAAAETSKS